MFSFLSWYYYAAPTHATFATVRRTMTLGNFAAFAIFTFFPCMPPRLLPKEYGFLDTVRQQNAESVWVGGNYVNQLAAMPSLHFTYAFCVGSTFLYHSGIFRRSQRGEARKPFYSFCGNKVWMFLLPAEDILCWILRVDKPTPTTGDRLKRKEAQYQPVKDEEDP
jgi:hypothetical protein